MRAVVRFLGAVMATSGVLLVGDAAVTLVWQEPLSAFLAGRQQDALADDFDARTGRVRRDLARLRSPGDTRTLVRRLARAERRRLRRGNAFGRIALPSLDRTYTVVQGTDTATLRKGPGHYPDTPLPGEGGTVGIAGHRTTYGAPFRTIDRLDRGDPIILTMPYAKLTYRVERTRIVRPDALWVKRPVGYDRVILSACHPLYSAAKRIIVFARLERATLPAGVSASPESTDDASRDSRKSNRATTSASEMATTAIQYMIRPGIRPQPRVRTARRRVAGARSDRTVISTT